MRVAQVAPLWEQVPPVGYGGTETVVSLLTEELVRRGHQVTLFASGDSSTLAHLEPGCDRALRSLGVLPPEYAHYETRQLAQAFARAGDFDVIHSHMDLAALSYGERSLTPVVHTVHGILTAVAETMFRHHRQENFVSISNSQRRDDLGLNYLATVYNAIALDQFECHPQPAVPPYLVFLGRMSVEKGPHLAIEAAGLRTLGYTDQALEIAQGIFDMTSVQPYQCPPELFCGFERTPTNRPVRYPVACSPQAWATGTVFQLLQIMVNLVPDVPNNCLRIVQPTLPPSVSYMSLKNFKIGHTLLDLEFERSQEATACRVVRKRGNLRVIIEV